MSFAENLIELRKYHNYSQEELAEMIGVSRQTMSKYETGESLPDIEKCKCLANAFGVTVDDLISYDKDDADNLGMGVPPKGKHIFGMVKVGDKGQIVIPAKARKIFDIQPGDNLIVLGDAEEINRAQVLADDGEHFYIAGYKFIKDTDKVSSARIIRMDHDGRNPAVVLEYVNEPDNETNLVLDISADDSSLYIVRDDLAEGTVIVTRYNTGTGSAEDILTTSIPADYTGKYDPKTGTLYVNDYYGRMFKISAGNPEPEQILEDYIVENYIPSKDGGLFWIESGSGNLYKNETLLLEDTGAYYVLAPYNDGVAYDSIDDSRLSIPDLDTGTVTHMNGADFSASYLLLSIVCSICILYLAVLIIILLVRAIRSMYLAGNYVQLKRTGIVVVLIASAVIIALLYTNKIIEIETQHLTEDISLYSHYFAESMDEQLLEDAVYTPEIGKDPEAWENYLEACGRLEEKYGFFRESLLTN